MLTCRARIGESQCRVPEHEAAGVEDLLHQNAEPQRGQSQEHPRDPHGRDGNQGANRHGDQRGQHQRQQPGQAISGREVPEGRRTHRRERQLAQGDLPGTLDQQAQRQQQDHVDQGARPHGQMAGLPFRHHRQQTDGDGPHHQAHRNGGVIGTVYLRLSNQPPLHQPAAGDHDQHQEQDQERQARRQPPDPADGGRVLVDQGTGDPDQQSPRERERQIREIPDGRRAEGREDQRGESHRIEKLGRRQHQPGDHGEHGADDPRPPPDPDRIVPAHRHQLVAVHHAPHDDAEAHRLEEPVQDRRRHHREDEEDDLLPRDVYTEEPYRRLRQEMRERRRVGRVPEQPERLDNEDQTDRGDHLDGLAGAVE